MCAVLCTLWLAFPDFALAPVCLIWSQDVNPDFGGWFERKHGAGLMFPIGEGGLRRASPV